MGEETTGTWTALLVPTNRLSAVDIVRARITRSKTAITKWPNGRDDRENINSGGQL